MKQLSRVITILIGLFIIPPVQANDPVAMITDMQGVITINRDNAKANADILSYLYVDDELNGSDNSQLTIVYLDPPLEFNIKRPKQVKIQVDTITSLNKSNIKSRDLKILQSAQIELGPENNLGQGSLILRGFQRKKIELLQPVKTIIMNVTPTFIWKSSIRNPKFHFALMDSVGQLMIETDLTATRFTLPEDITLKSGEDYTWFVSSKSDNGKKYSSSSTFSLLDKERGKKITIMKSQSKNSVSEQVLFARFLEKLDLKQLAKEQWNLLLRERPNSNSIRKKTK